MKLLSVTEAAKLIPNAITGLPGVTRGRVKHMIRDGLLPAVKIGNQWAINPKDIERLAGRSNGRPPREG